MNKPLIIPVSSQPVGSVRFTHLRCGRVLREWDQPCHSYTLNFLLACKQSFDLIQATKTNITGTPFANFTNTKYHTGITANRGIVVGSSNAVSDFDDIALGTLITGGIGADQLVIGDQAENNTLTVGERVSTISRTFTNSSAGNVTVREVGLYAATHITDTNLTNLHCILREVIVDIVLAVSDQLFVEFVFDLNGGSSMLNSNGTTVRVRMGQNQGLTVYNTIGGNSSTEINATSNADPAQITAGIVVGTSDTAVNKLSSAQLNLLGRCINGSGAGELLYGQSSWIDIVSDAAGGYMDHRRSVINNSGGLIDLKELGLFTSFSTSCMLGRVVLPATVSLGDQAAVEFILRFSLTH